MSEETKKEIEKLKREMNIIDEILINDSWWREPADVWGLEQESLELYRRIKRLEEEGEK